MHSGCIRLYAAMLPVWAILLVIQLPAQRPAYKPRGSAEKAPLGSSMASREVEVQEPSANPSSTGNSVDVINGSTRRTQVFSEESPAGPRNRPTHGKREKRATQKEPGQKEPGTAPSVPEVDVINGARLETRRFVDAEDEITAPWFERRISQPVVVDVASVESMSRRGSSVQIGSTASVVVGVASSEAHEHGANAKPIAYRVAPDPPKRPPYNPGPPGAQ
jgi:hypothetical protein